MEHEKFHYKTEEELKEKLRALGAKLPLSGRLQALGRPVRLGTKTAANSIAIQPMEGCDGEPDGSPGALTLRRYERFARSGAGLIWGEAVAAVPEGRANPRQLWLHEENLAAFQRMVDAVKETCLRIHGFEPILLMQVTHSGRYSKPEGVPAPLIAYNNPVFEKETPIPQERIVTDDYLYALEEKFGEAARLAKRAGFDGADIKCCHRYLCSELLSAYTRKGAFGGSLENRSRLLRHGIQNAAAAAGKDFLVTTRLNVYDGFAYPYGFGVKPDGGNEPAMEEPLELIGRLYRELGVLLVNVTIGNPYVNPHVNRPYDNGPYVPDEHPLEGVARMCRCAGAVQRAYPGLKVVLSGISYLRQFSGNLAAGAIEEGVCSVAGFGREAFAYPEFASELLAGRALDPRRCCAACGKCTELMRAGSRAGCVLRDPKYLALYRRDVLLQR